MAAISAATCLSLTDKLTALWLAAVGTDATTYGLGRAGATSRALKKAQDLESLIIALADVNQIVPLLQGAQMAESAVTADNAVGPMVAPAIAGLSNTCRIAALSGVTDLDSFSRYYNVGAGAPWACLHAPDFRDLYYSAFRQYPTAYNVYMEILQGATYTNALRKLVVGTGQTGGQDIDATKFAGGFGQVNVASITGSGVVTVTGDWRKPDGTVNAGVAGTATVSGTGATVLTPPDANDLLIRVTAISAAAGISAGTIYAEAKRPTGRTNPPT